MSLSTLCFISVFASTFSAVLCVPQISASNDISNDIGASSLDNVALGNIAASDLTSSKDNSNHVAYSGEPDSTPSTFGSAILDSTHVDPSTDNDPDIAFIITPVKPNTKKISETPEKPIEDTPGERAAALRHPISQDTPAELMAGRRARHVVGRTDDCPLTTALACCSADDSYCKFVHVGGSCEHPVCCSAYDDPAKRDVPDDYCPDVRPSLKPPAPGYWRFWEYLRDQF